MKRFKSILVCAAILMVLLIPASVSADTGLNVTATPVSGQNYIKLGWTNLGAGYTYTVYSKGQGEAIYQSIPSKGSVTVLNIYPSPITNTGLSGGGKDLDGNAIPDSGILKTWLDKENIKDVKIQSVSLTSFNANPSKYLYKTNGKWNYDCVFYGMWNLDPAVMYPNNTAIEYLRTFIHEGGGFMTSHHTIGYRGLDRGINKLANEMGVEIFGRKQANSNTPYSCRDVYGNLFPTVSFELDDPSSLSTADWTDYWNSSTKVKIAKKGLLTNYPFQVGDVGTTFDIPPQHGLSVFGKGDVWMTSINPTTFKEINTSPSTGAKGTNNFYIHTYNNTAIINSGHSFPSITQAETRIIANTLYYLAQLTSTTSCEDHKGQDVTNPDIVNISSVSCNTGKLTVNYSQSGDNGTMYEYYIKAKNDSTGTEIASNTVVATNTSGLAGYSYVIDNIPGTVPDNKIDTTSLAVSVPLSGLDLTKPAYIHIRAVDNVGNASETTHYEYKFVNKLELDQKVINLKEGAAKKLNAAVTSYVYSNSDVKWKSSNEAVAKVDSEGNVTAAGAGIAEIKAQINGTEISASCEVNVYNIALDKTSIALEPGGTVKLTATASASTSVIWTSSNEAAAKVDAEGNVTAVGTGKAVITAKINGTDIAANCEVNVYSLTLNKTAVSLGIQGTQKLTATASASAGIVWTSSNEAVAKVDAEGNVTALGTGKAIITAKIDGTGIATNCEVNVYSLTLNKAEIVLGAGETQKLAATTAASAILWSSSNETVAKVDAEGNVTAVGKGTAVITARIEGTGISAACAVTVFVTPLGPEPEENTVKVNDIVSVPIVIDNIKEIAAADIRIKYDSRILQYVAAVEVDGFRLMKTEVKMDELRLILQSTGSAKNEQTKHILLKLNFKAIDAGDASIGIVKARVNDGIDIERELTSEECVQAKITVE